MNGQLVNNCKWLDWLKEYEAGDPEPILILAIPNKFDHTRLNGTYVAYEGNLGYPLASRLAHMAWHRRMTDAYKKRGL